MHKVILSIRIVKKGIYIEVIFDDRLTFKENLFVIFEAMKIDIDVNNMTIYDPVKKVVLITDKPLYNFFLNNHRVLYVFYK